MRHRDGGGGATGIFLEFYDFKLFNPEPMLYLLASFCIYSIINYKLWGARIKPKLSNLIRKRKMILASMIIHFCRQISTPRVLDHILSF